MPVIFTSVCGLPLVDCVIGVSISNTSLLMDPATIIYRYFVKMLFCNDPLRNDMTLTNRANPSQKITIIPDPSHLIKKIRNSAFNSGHDSQHTRLLMVDGSVIIWKHWEETWEWCKDREINPVAPHHKLNKDYIYLTTQAKMRNI